MVKKTLLTLFTIVMGTANVYAAGGEINATITQDSTITSSKVIGAPQMEFTIGKDLPIIGGIDISTDARTKINEITNKGSLNGTITQSSDISDTVIVGSQINTIDNTGNISNSSTISQENNMDGNGNVIVGTSVNSIVNK